MEVWKEINGADGYFVSSLGKIKHGERTLKPFYTRDGYLLIDFPHKRTRTMHRVVAEAFVPNPEGLPQINHIDGDKTNNAADNLEWTTAKMNLRHAIDSGLWSPPKGKTPVAAKFDSMVIEFAGVNAAARFIGCDHRKISIAAKKNAVYHGARWSYAGLHD